MVTSRMTLAAIVGLASAVGVGKGRVMIQASPIDGNGLPSGSTVRLSSSDPTIVTVTTLQRGRAPASLVGQRPGSAVITATALDGSGVTATLSVTVG